VGKRIIKVGDNIRGYVSEKKKILERGLRKPTPTFLIHTRVGAEPIIGSLTHPGLQTWAQGRRKQNYAKEKVGWGGGYGNKNTKKKIKLRGGKGANNTPQPFSHVIFNHPCQNR